MGLTFVIALALFVALWWALIARWLTGSPAAAMGTAAVTGLAAYVVLVALWGGRRDDS